MEGLARTVREFDSVDTLIDVAALMLAVKRAYRLGIEPEIIISTKKRSVTVERHGDESEGIEYKALDWSQP